MNNMGPTAQIINRSDWTTDIDFVGHRKAVTCVVSDERICLSKCFLYIIQERTLPSRCVILFVCFYKRFNQRIFWRKVQKGSKDKLINYCCCAVGSRDASCSVWVSHHTPRDAASAKVGDQPLTISHGEWQRQSQQVG